MAVAARVVEFGKQVSVALHSSLRSCSSKMLMPNLPLAKEKAMFSFESPGWTARDFVTIEIARHGHYRGAKASERPPSPGG